MCQPCISPTDDGDIYIYAWTHHQTMAKVTPAWQLTSSRESGDKCVTDIMPPTDDGDTTKRWWWQIRDGRNITNWWWWHHQAMVVTDAWWTEYHQLMMVTSASNGGVTDAWWTWLHRLMTVTSDSSMTPPSDGGDRCVMDGISPTDDGDISQQWWWLTRDGHGFTYWWQWQVTPAWHHPAMVVTDERWTWPLTDDGDEWPQHDTTQRGQWQWPHGHDDGDSQWGPRWRWLTFFLLHGRLLVPVGHARPIHFLSGLTPLRRHCRALLLHNRLWLWSVNTQTHTESLRRGWTWYHPNQNTQGVKT